MFYNQQIATTSEICLTESLTGNFCAEKEISTITTFNWFDNILLFMIPITIIYVIGLFKRKK